MKKIYSAVTLFIMAALSFCASAQAAEEVEGPIDRVITFNGDDRLSIQLGVEGEVVHPKDGKLVVNVPAAKETMTIIVSAEDPELVIESVKDSQGNEIINNGGVYRVYPRNYGPTETITVTTKDVDLSNAFMIIVDKPDKIKIRRQGGAYDDVLVKSAQFDVPIAGTDDENTFVIEHKTNGGIIYNVNINGKKARVQANGRRWYIDAAKAGDVVEITVETPDVMVPVKFTGNKGAINKVWVNDEETKIWEAEDFAVKLNSTFKIEYKLNWKVARLEINGERVLNINNFDIVDEGETVIEVVADEIRDLQITVKCADYKNISVKNVTPIGTNEIELTGEETTFPVTRNTELSFVTEGAYYIAKFSDNVGGIYEVPTKSIFSRLTTRYVTYEIELGKFERKEEITVFLEDANWNNVNFTLTNRMGHAMYSAGENFTTAAGDNKLAVGYNHLPFDENDQVSVSGYNPDLALKVFHNGEAVTDPGAGFSDVKTGDVIKIFSAQPKAYAVKYDIQEGADVEVIHDIKSAVETPAEHSLFHGTDIVIRRPVKAEARAEEPKALQVTVNGDALTAEADGSFHIVATKDMNIQVKDPSASGIANVAVDGQEGPQEIYNLQGMRVGNTADGAELPSGIYIIGGKKVKI